MFTETLTVVARTLPLDTDFRDAYGKAKSREQEYILNLAIFPHKLLLRSPLNH